MRGRVDYPGHALHGRAVEMLGREESVVHRGLELGPLVTVRAPGDAHPIRLAAGNVTMIEAGATAEPRETDDMAQKMKAGEPPAAGHNVEGQHKLIRKCAAQMNQIKAQRQALNEEAADIRQTLRDAGIQTKVFDHHLRLRDLEEEAQKQWLEDQKLMIDALPIGTQLALLPEDDAGAEMNPAPAREAAFADGRKAGLDGVAADSNPHGKADPLATIWMNGWKEGQTELAKGLAPKGAPSAKPKRQRKAKAAPAAASPTPNSSLAMEEGREAGETGKGPQTNPYGDDPHLRQVWESARSHHFKKPRGAKATAAPSGGPTLIEPGPKTQANTAGFKAAVAGQPESDNPHPKGSDEHDYWGRGHHSAIKLGRAQGVGSGPADPPQPPAAA